MSDITIAAPKTLVGVKGDALKIKTVLESWSGKDVLSAADLPVKYLQAEERERHLLYVQLVMSLVYKYWNGNKKGRDGTYRFRDAQLKENTYESYLGHNIAAIAVDGDGRVADFDF